MKEYKVAQINISNSKISELFSMLYDEVSSEHILFEITNIENEYSNKSKWNDCDIEKFKYARNMSDKQEIFASNLSEVWEYSNPNIEERVSLTKEQAFNIVKVIDKAGWRDYVQFMIVLDRIPWNGDTVSEGTYGYTKAKSWNYHGKDYLSNSIILYKGAFEKSGIYVSYETEYEDSVLLKEILTDLDKVKNVETYYAPSDEQERIEFQKRAEVAGKSFWNMVDNVTEMYESGKLPYPFRGFNPDISDSWLEGVDGGFTGDIDMDFPDIPEDTINVKKIAKKILEPSGWKLAKKGFKFEKEHKDEKIILEFDSLHKGHKLAILITYYNEKFHLYTNLGFSCRLADEEAVEQYCIDVRYMMEYVESVLE